MTELSEVPSGSGRLQNVIDQVLEKLRQGEVPSVEEYAQAYPDLASEIRDVVSTLAVVEFLKPAANRDDDATAASSQAAAPASPPELDGYHVLREVDRGGMGIVYEALQTRLNRRVALKVLPGNLSHNEKMRQRFELETRAAAKLQHPQIVPVFDAGIQEDVHYYAMQFIEGLNLKDVISGVTGFHRQQVPATGSSSVKSRVLIGALVATQNFGDTVTRVNDAESIADGIKSTHVGGRRVSTHRQTAHRPTLENYFRNVAQLVQQIAEALAYAHEHGVVHRDIKPSNVILDYQGHPWLADFGLAKTQDEDITKTGDVVGTLRYLAPERIRGESNFGGDIYALGATLYELVTLRPMVMSSEPSQALDEILSREPISPRRIDAQIPADLETIILKSVAKQPEQRYLSAAELADDLARFVDGRPVLARPVSASARAWRWSKRNPALASTMAALVLMMLMTTIGSVAAALSFRDLAQRERDSRLAAESAESKATDALAGEQAAREEETRQRIFAQAINEFVIDDILSLTSVEGQFRFGESGYDLGQDASLRDLLDRAASKLESRQDLDPRSQAKLNWIVGVSYRASGDLNQSIPFLERAVELSEQAEGSDSELSLQSKISLAAALSANGEFPTANRLIEAVQQVHIKQLGEDDPQTVLDGFRIHLGNAIAGKLKQSIPAIEQDVQRLERLLGPVNTYTLDAKGHFATVLFTAGQAEKANRVCQDALEQSVEANGIRHPDSIDLLQRYVDILQGLGKHELALEQVQILRQTMEELYGPDAPLTLGAGVTLGTCYRQLGQVKQAIEEISKNRDRLASRLGDHHPAVAIATRELANAHKDQGNFSTAIQQMDQAIASMEIVFSDKQLELLRARLDRVNLLIEMNRSAEAVEQAEALLKSLTDILGDEHPDVNTCLNHLGNAYLTEGDLPQARKYLQQASEGIDPETQPVFSATTSNNLARILLHEKAYSEAIELLTRARELAEAHLPTDHRVRLVIQDTLAAAYEQSGELELAIPLWKHSLERFRETVGDRHPDTIMTQNNLAFGYMKLQQFEQAIPMLQSALEIDQGNQGPPGQIRFLLMNNLSAALRNTGQIDKGIQLLRETLQMAQQQIGAGHPQTLFYHRNLGVALYQKQDYEGAIEAFGSAREACAKRFGPDHVQTLRLAGNLGINQLAAGKIDDAVATLTPVESAAKQEPMLAFVRKSLLQGLAQQKSPTAAVEVAQRWIDELEISKAKPHEFAQRLQEVAELVWQAGASEPAASWLSQAIEKYQEAGENELADTCQKRLAEMRATEGGSGK